ncbi:MAG: tetratricopeptide repeat protein [Tannerellaceae bacterium]|jgi:tetratricopeptide (TPR) repeat protein|nr:tetratricopeptide repeat protein [Tannerellaceae bacterium]
MKKEITIGLAVIIVVAAVFLLFATKNKAGGKDAIGSKADSIAADALASEADQYFYDGLYEEATARFVKAVELYPSYSNTLLAAEGFRDMKMFDKAKEYYSRCLKMELHPFDRASALHELGSALKELKEYPEAEKAYLESLEIFQKLLTENPNYKQYYLTRAFFHLGLLYAEIGNYKKAAEYYNKELEIERALNTGKFDVASTLNYLGDAHYGAKEYEKAERCYSEALAIYREDAQKDPDGYIYSHFFQALSLGNLGKVYANKAKPDYAKAEEYFHESLNFYRLDYHRLAAARLLYEAEEPADCGFDLVNALINTATFYHDKVPNKELSIELASEAIATIEGCDADPDFVEEAGKKARLVLEKWK